MSEIKGYTCDGGCGATTALDSPIDTLMRHGWSVAYTPLGFPTIYACSLLCLSRAAERVWNAPHDRGLRA
jgi:hypothetical protein